MKKILTALIAYSLIAGIVIFLLGCFTVKMPVLISADVMSYKINNGLLVLMVSLPSVLITGFLLGCAIQFGQVKVPGLSRFSAAIADCFKQVLILGVGLTFVLAIAHDICVPVLEQRKTEYEEKPVLISQYLELSKLYLLKSLKNSEYANLATFYSKKVLELEPKNERALSLSKRAELAGAVKNKEETVSQKENASYYVSSDGGITGNSDAIDTTEIFKIQSSSVYELLTEAEKLFENYDYLGAHYYAQMAVKMAGPKDVNLEKARELSNKAWNILSEAKVEQLTEENLFYRKKVEGYSKLMAGDYLSSYYIFQTLNNEKFAYSRDADVKRYLNIARYELTQQYFFIDETTDKDTFESAEKVYFSLRHQDGSYDIFFIKGITDIYETGNLVRYLREVRIYSFDAYGDFTRSMIVPYAKMLAIDVDTLSEEQIAISGIDKKWKRIPYLLLCSVDRDQEGVRISPVYTGLNNSHAEGPNQMLLTMAYDDFGIISQCTNGVQKMNFWTMNKMKLPADSYGYSNEIIMQSALLSVFYPFVIFALLILTAVIGWNYRLQANKLFKFVWVFIIPFVNVIIYGAVGFFEFTIKLFNFILMGALGINYALPAGVVCYMLIVVVMSFIFLSRKGD